MTRQRARAIHSALQQCHAILVAKINPLNNEQVGNFEPETYISKSIIADLKFAMVGIENNFPDLFESNVK